MKTSAFCFLPTACLKGSSGAAIPTGISARKQPEKIAGVLAEKPGVETLDWQSCYQSRVGPLKWIDPSIEEALDRAARDKKCVIVYPHAFTQEHVETLVELDMEYKRYAKASGIKGYYRAQTVGAEQAFIDGLAALVRDHLDKTEISAEGGKPLCPDHFPPLLYAGGGLVAGLFSISRALFF